MKRGRGRPRRYPAAGQSSTPASIPAVILPGANGQTLVMAPLQVCDGWSRLSFSVILPHFLREMRENAEIWNLFTFGIIFMARDVCHGCHCWYPLAAISTQFYSLTKVEEQIFSDFDVVQKFQCEWHSLLCKWASILKCLNKGQKMHGLIFLSVCIFLFYFLSFFSVKHKIDHFLMKVWNLEQ